jgi:hypothetical protein
MPTIEETFQKQQEKDISGTVLPAASNFPRILKKFGEYNNAVAGVSGSEAKSPWEQQQFQQAKTAHYHDHFFDPYQIPDDGIARTIELAHFPVPVGSMGIIRKLNQWVNGDYTLSDHWGNPFTGAAPDDYLWILRLTPYENIVTRLVYANTYIPGFPYPDLPEWRYLWFFPHASGSDLNLVVPGGYCLRLFVHVPAVEDQDDQRVFGRIVGYWQSSEVNDSAGNNASKGF